MSNRQQQKQKEQKQPRQEPSTFRWFFGHVFSLLRRHGGAIVAWLMIGYSIQRLSAVFIAYAGKTSIADLTLKVLANVSVVWTMSLTLSGISITLYVRERPSQGNPRAPYDQSHGIGIET